MADAFTSTRGSGVLLFDEDFDRPSASGAAEPEVIEPVFTLAELRAAREQAAMEGRGAALAEARMAEIAASGQALTAIAEQMSAARTEVASMAEHSSEAIARLLLRSFAIAFPALSARHGITEAAALLRHILPALHREPKITVRVNPHIVAALAEEIQSLDPDLTANVRFVATDAIAIGDVRVTWDRGAATRDTGALWKQIENVLTQAGLSPPTVPPLGEPTAREAELVE